jgi:hypothetical protein
MTLSNNDIIRIVVFREHGKWVGQCLELDIGAQADDAETLFANLEVAINVDRNSPDLGPAPKHYFDLWDRCSDKVKQVRQAPGISWALCA